MQATPGTATLTDKILEKLAARLAEETKGEARHRIAQEGSAKNQAQY